jgi:tetratricopeptide (TPR) repeat protein
MGKDDRYLPRSLDALLSSSPTQLNTYDVAVMNLLCATGLPGAEDLDVPHCLATLDTWTAHVRRETDRNSHLFLRNLERCNHSEAVFRAMMLVQVLKQDFGIHYHPDRIPSDDRCHLGYLDSKELFIHGLLGEERGGTCNSIPVLVVAIGRRLGYPLKLVSNPYHLFVRWESPGGGERFNIEASNDGGMNRYPDDHYKSWPRPMTDAQLRCGCYLDCFTPADELALCLISRTWTLERYDRLTECLPSLAGCCFLAPGEPTYCKWAAHLASTLLERLQAARESRPTPKRSRTLLYDDQLDPRKLLPSVQAAMALSIFGHWHELGGRDYTALPMYAEAQRLKPRHRDYAHDLDRIIRKIAAAEEPGIIRANRHPRPEQWAEAHRQIHGKGVRLESEGDEERAIVHFAVAAILDPDDAGSRASLRRLARRELLEPRRLGIPVRVPPPHGFVCARGVTASDQAAALLIAERGNALEEQGDFGQAVLAFVEAQRLDWGEPAYPKALHRAARRYAERATAASMRAASRLRPAPFSVNEAVNLPPFRTTYTIDHPAITGAKLC